MPSNQNKVIELRHKQSRTSGRVRLTKYYQTVLKIKRYGQRLTQGYSLDGGCGCWAPGGHVIENLNIHEIQKQIWELSQITMLTSTKAEEIDNKYEV